MQIGVTRRLMRLTILILPYFWSDIPKWMERRHPWCSMCQSLSEEWSLRHLLGIVGLTLERMETRTLSILWSYHTLHTLQ